MPHMSNLPWLQTYFMIIMLIFIIMLYMYFIPPFMPLNQKITNGLSTKTWKW